MPVPNANREGDAEFSKVLPTMPPRGSLWFLLGAAFSLGAALTFVNPLRAKGGASMGLELKTTAFKPGGDIPRKFTCDGADVSPALSWNAPPAGTKSFALISDDPDAPVGTWVHWVVFDIPANVRELPEGVPRGDDLKSGGRQGRNDFPHNGYGGPCPPPGKPHRYFFKLYALDTMLNLKPGATKRDVEQAMKGHDLAHAELMGRYGR